MTTKEKILNWPVSSTICCNGLFIMLDHNDHCQLKNHLIVVGLFEISLFSVCRSMLSIIIIKMEMEWSIALCTRTHTLCCNSDRHWSSSITIWPGWWGIIIGFHPFNLLLSRTLLIIECWWSSYPFVLGKIIESIVSLMETIQLIHWFHLFLNGHHPMPPHLPVVIFSTQMCVLLAIQFQAS